MVSPSPDAVRADPMVVKSPDPSFSTVMTAGHGSEKQTIDKRMA
jgi:hypothetical protein